VTFPSFAPRGSLRVGSPLIPSSRMISPTALWPTLTPRPYLSSAVTRLAP